MTVKFHSCIQKGRLFSLGLCAIKGSFTQSESESENESNSASNIMSAPTKRSESRLKMGNGYEIHF